MTEKIPAFCINLKDRKDRWERVQNEFRDFRLNVQRFDAIKHSNGHDGCIESHRELLRKAKGYYEFLVFEDDVKFIGTRTQFLAAYDQLPDNYDGLYLGATLIRQQERYSDNLYKLYGGLTTHAILWNNQNGVVDYIIKNMHGPHIDGFMAGDVQYNFNIYICYPIIATQEAGHSDIVNRKVDYAVITETYKKYTQ